MNLSRNLIQAAAGGLLGGSLLGLAEAAWIISRGAPDLLAPFYAVVLYGIIGVGLGMVGGVLLTIWGSFRKLATGAHALAFAAGAAATIVPIGLFVLNYLVNKEVYAEAGVPKPVLAGIAGFLLVVAYALLTAGKRALLGPLSFLLGGRGVVGAWGSLAAVTGGLALLPMGDDPRATWDAGKAISDELKSKPNVLLIAVDTLRADHLGTYGMKGNPTPAIDAFAKDGVVFEQHIGQASWTRASFASLFSSRIPSSHNADKKASRLSDDVVLLSEALQDGDVVTANLANNINVSSTFGFDQGYDTFIYESPDYPYGATESVFGLTLYKVLHKLTEKLGPKVGLGKDVATFYQPADVVLKDAQGFIQANADSRFYLGIHLMEPHDPYFEHPYLTGKGDAEFNGVGYARAEHESPDPKDAEYLQGVYVDEIRHMDKKLAAFFDWMKKEKIYDDTLIILTADHGEEFNEHGGFWHGTTLYDEQIHIPLLIKLPKNELAGTRVKWQSRAIDVAPTVTAAMGVDAGEGWMGADLFAGVKDELELAAQRRESIVSAQKVITDAEAALAAAPDDTLLQSALQAAQAELAKLNADDPCAIYSWVLNRPAISQEDFEGNIIESYRQNGFKMIQAQAGNPRGLPEHALFDVAADVGEKDNLFGKTPEKCGGTIKLDEVTKTLETALKDKVTEAKSGAAASGEVKMSAGERKKLCALGYLSGADCEGL